MRSASCDFDVVSCLHADAYEIGSRWRVHPRAHEELGVDEFLDLRAFDQCIEDPTKPPTITAAWRGSEADQYRIRIGRDDLAVGLSGRVMTLINDN